MVPNISDEIVEKQKTLQSGTCLGFGMAFTIPLIVKLRMPEPEPRSGNCDVVNIWNGRGGTANNTPSPATPSQPAQQSIGQPVVPSFNTSPIMPGTSAPTSTQPMITVPIKDSNAAL